MDLPKFAPDAVLLLVPVLCWYPWLCWLRTPLLLITWALRVNDALDNLVWLLAEGGLFVQFDAMPGNGKAGACTGIHHGTMGAAVALGVATGRWLLGGWLVGGGTFGLLYGCILGRALVQRVPGGPAEPALRIRLSLWPFEISIQGLVADEATDQAGVWGGMMDLGWAAPAHLSLRKLRLKLPVLRAFRGAEIELDGLHIDFLFHADVRSVLEKARAGTGLGGGDTVRALLDSGLSPNQVGMDAVLAEATATLAKLRVNLSLVSPKPLPWWKRLFQGKGAEQKQQQQQPPQEQEQQQEQKPRSRGSATCRGKVVSSRTPLREKLVAEMEKAETTAVISKDPLAPLLVLRAAFCVLERAASHRTSLQFGSSGSQRLSIRGSRSDALRDKKASATDTKDSDLRHCFEDALFHMRERLCEQLHARGVAYELESVRFPSANAELLQIETLLDLFVRAREGKLTNAEAGAAVARGTSAKLVSAETQRGWLEYVINGLISGLKHLVISDTRVELKREETKPLPGYGSDAKPEPGFDVVAQIDSLALLPSMASEEANLPPVTILTELKEAAAVWKEAFAVHDGEPEPVSQQLTLDGLQIFVGGPSLDCASSAMSALLVPGCDGASHRLLTLQMEHGNLYGPAAPECNTPNTSCESNELKLDLCIAPLQLCVSVQQLSQLSAFMAAMYQFNQWQVKDSKAANDCCLNDTSEKHLTRYRDVFWTAEAQPPSLGAMLALIGIANLGTRLVVPTLVQWIPFASWVLAERSSIPLLSSLLNFWCGMCACNCGQSDAAAESCAVTLECGWSFHVVATMPAFWLFLFGTVLHFMLSKILRAAGVHSPLQVWEDAVQERRAMETEMDVVTILAHRYFARSAADELRSTELKPLPTMPHLSGDLSGDRPCPTFAKPGQRLVADLERFLELGKGQMLDYYDLAGREADYVWHNFAQTAFPRVRANIVADVIEVEIVCSTESTAMTVLYPGADARGDEPTSYPTGHSVAVVAFEQLELSDVFLSMVRTQYSDALGTAATIRLQQIDVLESFHFWWFRAKLKFPLNEGSPSELKQLKQEVADHLVGSMAWHCAALNAVTSSFTAMCRHSDGDCALLGAYVTNQLVPVGQVKKVLESEFDAELCNVDVGTIFGQNHQEEFLASLDNFDDDVAIGRGACGDFRDCKNRTFASLLGNVRGAGHAYRQHGLHPHRGARKRGCATPEPRAPSATSPPAISLTARLTEEYNYPRASYESTSFAGVGEVQACPPPWCDPTMGSVTPDLDIRIADLVCVAPNVLGLLSGFNCAMDGRYEGDQAPLPTAAEAGTDSQMLDLDPETGLSFYLPREEIVAATYPQEVHGTLLGLEFSKLSVAFRVGMHVIIVADLQETNYNDWNHESRNASAHSSFHGNERNSYMEERLVRQLVLSLRLDGQVSN